MASSECSTPGTIRTVPVRDVDRANDGTVYVDLSLLPDARPGEQVLLDAGNGFVADAEVLKVVATVVRIGFLSSTWRPLSVQADD